MTDANDARLGGENVHVVYDANAIAQRVAQLGAEITSTYRDGELVLLGLLKGSFVFMADLVREIRRPLHVDFLVASSYGAGKTSRGSVDLVYDPNTVLRGRDIVLVEDIVDSGRTLARLLSVLEAREPNSVEVCALLHKQPAPFLPRPVRFVGFQAPDAFLVGYGLDHAENFRHLPYIARLD